MIRRLTMAAAFTFAALGQPAEPEKLSTLFAQVGLTAEQRADVNNGRPVAKVLSWGKPSEMYVFGAVHIDGSPAAYLTTTRHVSRLAGSEGYLGIGELPEAATEADVAALTLDPDDIKALQSCREGSCDIQLPTAAIQAFHDAVNRPPPDAANQANGLARRMVLALVAEYRRGGNEALGVYRDKQTPARVADEFDAMVSRSAALPEVLPELRRYLLHYPNADLPAADSFFYWEKVAFGMKPTIRVNHAVIYRAPARDDISVVAVKQLYASHYFHTALDVSVCFADAATSGRQGFYLITLKGSEQDGLTGVKGSLLRKIVIDKTRSSLEKALASIKQTVEHAAPAPVL